VEKLQKHKLNCWFVKEIIAERLALINKISLGKSSTAANSVFIKLWLEVKHSAFNLYFAFVVN
jgi:hypothetical protein